MLSADFDMSQLADADDPEAQRICLVDRHLAPRKAMLRRAAAGYPHAKVGNQIVFYKPILRAYMAQKMKAKSQANLPGATCDLAGTK